MPPRLTTIITWFARRPTVAVMLLAALLFLWQLGSNRALTEHETLVAGPAKQMVASGDWLVLWIGDRTWLEKPPLPEWLAGLSSIALGGFTETSVRLPFALCGLLVVWLQMRLATRLFNGTIGWLSGLVQCTSVYMVAYARLCEADVVLLALYLAALTLFHEAESRRKSLAPAEWRRWRFAFWIVIGLTNLAKGIGFGALLALFTCAGWLIVSGDWRGLRRWVSPLGILAAVAIAVAWPVAVSLRDPSALQLWYEHTFRRAADGIGYSQPWWYYFSQWPVQLLPWTPWVVIGAWSSLRTAWQQLRSSERFCWFWFAGQLALLSCSSGKNHHYLLYALPALAPIAASGLLTSATHLATWGVRPHRVSLAAAALFATIVGGHLTVQTWVMPRRDQSAADKQFLQMIGQHLPDNCLLAASGRQEIARHVFYVDRPLIGVWCPSHLPNVLPAGATTAYVIDRASGRHELGMVGRVEQVAQSPYTRKERNLDDRFTLFRVELNTPAGGAATTAAQPVDRQEFQR
ncbi:MAG: glycosyltransferase family 39 protein [Planctomycetes bacterium]|nr:glycosyltransferase family 39 protein [Planctomycetota bacterium]